MNLYPNFYNTIDKVFSLGELISTFLFVKMSKFFSKRTHTHNPDIEGYVFSYQLLENSYLTTTSSPGEVITGYDLYPNVWVQVLLCATSPDTEKIPRLKQKDLLRLILSFKPIVIIRPTAKHFKEFFFSCEAWLK